MERNQIIGFGLIFVLLIVWTFVNSPSKDEVAAMKERQDSLNRVEQLADSIETEAIISQKTPAKLDSSVRMQRYGTFSTATQGENQTLTLENEFFEVEFHSLGGKISSVKLKDYQKSQFDENKKEFKVPLYLQDDPKNEWNIALPTNTGDLNTQELLFTPEVQGQTIRFTATGSQGETIVQEYSLTDNPFEIKYQLGLQDAAGYFQTGTRDAKLSMVNYLGKLERNSSFERSYSTMYYKEATESVDYCSCRGNDQDDLSTQPIKWFSHSNQFFNSTIIADQPMKGGVFETRMLEDEAEALKVTSAVVGLPLSGAQPTVNMTFYMGPNDFENLRHYHLAIEDIIPFGQSIFGSINRWVIRPMFNFLIDIVGSKGFVILLLTLLVKLALFPLSYKMLQSQAKMSALKPQLAGMREKYKDDMQKMQMESMKVYREYGVNPLGGCFPVLLQMPVWFALYRFFPASIEFRQASFLWATDLSSFDVFFYLPFEIPMFGAHVSLLTLLWTISTIAYTYYNMQHMDMTQMNPALKWMQYLMPVMFLVFFNSYASGLTLYLVYSNLLNILQTVGAKKFLFDEDKIMEGLNKNKAKPKKEGGFQARLEQALKEQQRIAEQKKNQAKANLSKKKK